MAVAVPLESGPTYYINGSTSGPQEAINAGSSTDSIPISSDSFYNYMMYLWWVVAQD